MAGTRDAQTGLQSQRLESICEEDATALLEVTASHSGLQRQDNGMYAPSALFPYNALPEHCIRLVSILPESTPDKIHCSLDVCSDYYTERVHYTAVSYCWGDPLCTKTIVLEGRPVPVTTNLYHALVAIHQRHGSIGHRAYWIDALCINQANGDERNHQVHQMWRIFSSADEVLAWLGPENEQTGQVFAAMRRLSDSCTHRQGHCPGWKKYHSVPADLDLDYLRRLLQREYFSRTWVIQEFVQARRLWILCGSYRLNESSLYHLQKMFSGLQAGELMTRRWLHGPKSTDTTGPVAASEAVTWLVNTLYSYSRSACTDIRDRIFALLGDPTMRKLDPMMQLRPDYSISADDLAVVFVQYCDMIISPWLASPEDELSSAERLAPQFDRLLYSLGQAFKVKSRHDFIRSIKSRLVSCTPAENSPPTFTALNPPFMAAGSIRAHILNKCIDVPPAEINTSLTLVDLKDVKETTSWETIDYHSSMPKSPTVYWIENFHSLGSGSNSYSEFVDQPTASLEIHTVPDSTSNDKEVERLRIGNLPYRCTYYLCHERFSHPTILESHIELAHKLQTDWLGGTQWCLHDKTIPACSRLFESPHALQVHRQSVHGWFEYIPSSPQGHSMVRRKYTMPWIKIALPDNSSSWPTSPYEPD